MKYLAEIKIASNSFQIEPELIMAIIKTESSFNKDAVRYESNWKYFFETGQHAKRLEITIITETIMQATSWGLMQVMGSVAREHGFTGPMHNLTIVSDNLFYGCKHLKKFMDKYKNIPDAVASYNAGRPVMINNKYKNQAYVSKVLNLLSEYKITEEV